MADKSNDNQVCDGCGERIELDETPLRPGLLLLHDRPSCVAAALEKLAGTPPPQTE